MPISFQNLVKNSRTIAIPLEDGSINVTYDPSKMSAAYMQELQSKLEEDDPFAMASLFCGIVTSWDVVGPMNEEGHNEFVAEGDVIPMEPRFIAWVPGPILQTIFTKIGEDASPKSQPNNSRVR